MAPRNKVLIIAEAGVNHNGSVALAKELIDIAAWAGADIVKFQTFKAESLVTRSAAKARYQVRSTGSDESQFSMLKKLELSFDSYVELSQYCGQKDIEFLSTAFDEECLAFLVKETGLRRIKIPSGELTNGPLIVASALTFLPLILSTGMATLVEIREALDLIASTLQAKRGPGSRGEFQGAFRPGDQTVSTHILHCTSEYPAPFDGLNLSAMQTIAGEFGLPVGYSDHSHGIVAPSAAVAMGATIIEKHFTKSRNLPGPDHKASLEPGELKRMVEDVRLVEVALGDGAKLPSDAELDTARIARKSLTAAAPIAKGEAFSPRNVALKRPGTGLSPMAYWDLLATRATRAYAVDDLLEERFER